MGIAPGLGAVKDLQDWSSALESFSVWCFARQIADCDLCHNNKCQTFLMQIASHESSLTGEMEV